MAIKSILWSALWGVLLFCILVPGCRKEDPTEKETASASAESQSSLKIHGKLAQTYVEGATVILDQLESGSRKGNCLVDAGEGSTESDASGAFSIHVDHSNYVICTIGGTYKNASGKPQPAAPMLAPAPDSSDSAWNVTPLTTLVTTHPELKSKLDEMGGWNADIASPEGVPAGLLRVAKAVETYGHLSKQLASSDNERLKAMEYLANSFKWNGISADNSTLLSSAQIALHNVMSDPEIILSGSGVGAVDKDAVLTHLEIALTDGVFNVISNSNTLVVEHEVLSKIEAATESATQIISGMLNQPPVLTETNPVPNYTKDITPQYVFFSTKSGTIEYEGACSSETTMAHYGSNEIHFIELAEGMYNNCSIRITDKEGNTSDTLKISTFTIDTTPPVLLENTPINSPSLVANPDYSFNTNEAGMIFYGGGCSSKEDHAITGDNTITFSMLQDGTYDNCTLQLADHAGNASNLLLVSPFNIMASGNLSPDTTAPVLQLDEKIDSPSTDRSPGYIFISSESGNLEHEGSCKSPTLDAKSGKNSITLNPLIDGTYSDCTIRVTDHAGNQSLPLALPAFTIDTTAPVLEESVAISSPDNDATPTFTFNSSEPGTLSFSRGCSSKIEIVSEGDNSITLDSLNDGTYDQCKFHVTDSVGNAGELQLTKFIVDTQPPILISVNPDNSSVGISLKPTITFVFSEPLDNTTLILNTDNTSCQGSVQLSADPFTSCLKLKAHRHMLENPDKFSFSPVDNLSSNTDYQFRVTSVVLDPAGNSLVTDNTSVFRFQTADVSSPILLELNAISLYTNNNTPEFTFSSSENGNLTLEGSCSSSEENITSGNNTISLNPLQDGSYDNCSILVEDLSGNQTTLPLSPFEVDTQSPELSLIQSITSPGKDTTPQMIVASSEMGQITYGGNCSSTLESANIGNNTITLNALLDGNHTGCTLQVTDLAGNSSEPLGIPSFIIDTVPPMLAEVSSIPTPTNTTTPSFSINTSESGTIHFEEDGACSTATTSTISGNQSIVLNSLEDGFYSECIVTLIDDAGNISLPQTLSSFKVDTTPPVLDLIEPIPFINDNASLEMKFHSTESGSIQISCGVSIETNNAKVGENHIFLNALVDQTYNDCTLSIEDDAGNRSEELLINAFTVDTKSPVLAVVTPIAEFTSDKTPSYVFTTDETGTLVTRGSCSIRNIIVTEIGEQSLVLDELADGIYEDCTIQIMDAAGNASNELNIGTLLSEHLSSFTVDTIAPIVSEEEPVENPTVETSPLYVFHSSESGTIEIGGACTTQTDFATQGKNNLFSFSDLAPGGYQDCTLSVMDFAGNISESVQITDFEVLETISVGFGIGFSPTIESINCEFSAGNPSWLMLKAAVKDDGPLSQLRYHWKFCKYCGSSWEKTGTFTSSFSNPTFLKNYSILSTSGTVILEVTDGNGLGGKSTRELNLSPGSC